MTPPPKAKAQFASALLLCALAAVPTTAGAAEHEAASAADVERLAPSLKPGDTVVLTDGVWRDQRIVLNAIGTAEQPITLRARTPGKTVFTGNSAVHLAGQHLVASGLHFKDVTGDEQHVTIALLGSHCRATQCAVENGSPRLFVHLFGPHGRLDHCYLAGKTSDGPTVQVEAPEGPPGHSRIDHNHFGHRPPLKRNGGETLRVGYSHQQQNEARLVCEFNLFDRCDGELEIVSSKSCGNVYRGNTFFDSAGTLTLRHGDRCVVDANVFLGRGKPGSGGIRVLGDGHVITNNYIDRVEIGAFWLTAGKNAPQPKDHVQASNCLIAHNTVVDSTGAALKLSAGYRAPDRTRRPERITLVNNVFRVGPDGALIDGTEGDGFRWAGNLAAGARAATDSAAPGRIRIVEDLKLARAANGGGDDHRADLWRPSPGSPVLDAAVADVSPRVELDLDGQPRTGKPDVGCDEVSTDPVTRRVLSPADVGPTWLTRKAGE